MSARAALLLGAAALIGFAAMPASAADQTQPLALGNGALVRGGAPLPEYHLNFMLDDPGRAGLPPAASSQDLDIALSTPNTGVFHFLFSPRPQFGFGYDRLTGANRGYAGLTWSLFDTDSVFGSIGLAGSYEPGATGLGGDPFGRSFGTPLMLHGAIELGYRLGEQHSLSLRLDEGRPPEFRLNSETSDNLRLRYGLKF